MIEFVSIINILLMKLSKLKFYIFVLQNNDLKQTLLSKFDFLSQYL